MRARGVSLPKEKVAWVGGGGSVVRAVAVVAREGGCSGSQGLKFSRYVIKQPIY